jgi:hypothetical protein
MQKEKEIPVITNLNRIDLVYKAVVTLEAQTWASRESRPPALAAAINLLEAVEREISKKYPLDSELNKGGRNAK